MRRLADWFWSVGMRQTASVLHEIARQREDARRARRDKGTSSVSKMRGY
jgi:ERCC4-type nuclease